jgi:hypothetical protein
VFLLPILYAYTASATSVLIIVSLLAFAASETIKSLNEQNEEKVIIRPTKICQVFNILAEAVPNQWHKSPHVFSITFTE